MSYDYTLDGIENAETTEQARAVALGAIEAVTMSPSAYDKPVQKIRELVEDKKQRIKELNEK